MGSEKYLFLSHPPLSLPATAPSFAVHRLLHLPQTLSTSTSNYRTGLSCALVIPPLAMSYPPGDPSFAAPADFRDTDRPTTARPATSSDYLYSQDDPQYTYSQEGIEEEEEEEEEEESEDEDVFAYLPPTTAEQQAQEAQEGHDDHLSHTSDPRDALPIDP